LNSITSDVELLHQRALDKSLGRTNFFESISQGSRTQQERLRRHVAQIRQSVLDGLAVMNPRTTPSVAVYGTDWLRDKIAQAGAAPNIPFKSNRR
jgi:hypothetical protein